MADNRFEFIRGSIKEREATREFESLITGDPELSGNVFYGYPLIKSENGRTSSPDAVVIAPNGQTTAIHICSGSLPENFRERQDDCFMAVDPKLGMQSYMRKGRAMRMTTQTLTFLPDLPESDLTDPDYPVVNRQGLTPYLRACQERNTDDLDLQQVTNAIIATNSETGFW